MHPDLLFDALSNYGDGLDEVEEEQLKGKVERELQAPKAASSVPG